jgi:hypothetical protein
MSEPTTTPPPRKRGCLFYGCLTSVVLLLLAALLAFLAIRYVRNQFNTYTDTAPMKLPKVEMSDAEFQQLQQRAKAFTDGMASGKVVEPLALNERDINALLLKNESTKAFADRAYLSLAGSNVTGQISIPLSGLGWLGKDRYLNGEATFNVSLENGVLIVTAKEVRVKGKPLPDSFMNSLRRENLAKDAYKDPKNAEAIRKLESLRVDDGRVTVKARLPEATR